MQHQRAQIAQNGLTSGGRGLKYLDNTSKGKGPNNVNLEITPQTAAYRSVIGLDADATRYARKAAREVVKMLRLRNDREPPTVLLEGIFTRLYSVKKDRVKHAIDIVRKTINKDREN
jgi:hypothetical protein